MTTTSPILPATAEEFFAVAHALETEAAERYAELAELMRSHHNAEVAELFERMARIETLHRDKVADRLPAGAASAAFAFSWETPEGPETADYSDLHYLMTPWHALKLAEHNERRAAAFYAQLAAAPLPDEVRAEAAEMAADEREHIRLIQEWLTRVPEPEPDWDEDLDPPNVAD
jgi:rubrerythrin